MPATWVGGLLKRRAARSLGVATAVALAVCILGSLGTFFAASKARMTERAVAGVPVDWQVQLSPDADAREAEHEVSALPGVRATLPVGFAETTGLRSSSGGSEQGTGPGKVLGLPGGYSSTFPGVIRPLIGEPNGVLLAQQTAANLHATVGTVVEIGRPGLPPARVTVQGIVDVPVADSLFQAIGSPPGTAPQAPPDNVLLLPMTTWHGLFDSVAVMRPDAVKLQLHVALSRSLPADPAAAFAEVIARAKSLEARIGGAGQVGNNLAALLDSARSDALYAELLFLFLGLPAVVLAGLVASTVAAAGADRRRREQALLRVRGAPVRKIVGFAITEALALGGAGAAAGIGAAIVVGRIAFGSVGFGASTKEAVAWVAAAAAAGLAIAGASILVPAWRDARRLSVSAARKQIGETARPLWLRLHADVVMLAAGGLIFWRVAKTGYQIVLAPEGIPTISVGYESVLAPLLLWAGGALFAWRLAGASLRRGRRVLAWAVRPLAAGLSGVVAASMSRQRRLLSRSLVLTALASSFAVSIAVFNSTYQGQARVDARLTTGADVAVSTAGEELPAGLVERARALPGVADAEPMQHRFAYVGNDLQDLYGIDAARIGRATAVSDAFFAGGRADETLGRLASRPDAVLVSEETVHDFQLHAGDLLRLRLVFAGDHAYHVVTFHFAGVVREFPTAPRDSFLVANAAYIGQATGLSGFQTLLMRTSRPPPLVAREVRAVLGPASGAIVQDIVDQLKIALSGLTAIDLAGLTRLELAFAVVLAAASSGLVIAIGLAERRRTFAIASALGARAHQVAAFLWSEAAFVAVGGLVFGALAGWSIAAVVVKMLTHVFDPPPEHLSIPYAYLGVVAVAALGAIVTAVLRAQRAVRRPVVEIIRDL